MQTRPKLFVSQQHFKVVFIRVLHIFVKFALTYTTILLLIKEKILKAFRETGKMAEQLGVLVTHLVALNAFRKKKTPIMMTGF